MPNTWIKNTARLATTPERQIVLDIIEAGYDAIDTKKIIQSQVSLNNQTLTIKGQNFDISGVKNIYVVGFGKPSCQAASVLDEILGDTIKQGVAIGLAPVACEYIQTYGGTHPRPSVQNVEVSEKIMELSKNLTEHDLVIVVVSGGGSALLCWPMRECEQANRLYEDFLGTGGDIKELNTVRKHISMLKGGGLAKELYPATVIGLIFSDVPGDNFDYIASGPTYKDVTTAADAQAILDKYHLTGYDLNETPDEDKYFEKVTNIPLVGNIEALDAMQTKAQDLGLKVKILSNELYDEPHQIAEKFLAAAEPGYVVLAGGEPKAIVTKKDGTGGRCARLGIEVLPLLEQSDVFAAIASDGLDNSEFAGVIEDFATAQKVAAGSINTADYKDRWDSLGFYAQTGNELLQTGPTQANVSDLMIMYRQ
ncbi:MAG TPA: DUF4147 domain-containing protein [Patescibacteria group bacterium]|jgi:glycerate-2-kinase|nr:DUF4147 domain-containing protein [Patescibacteria group bacterium]